MDAKFEVPEFTGSNSKAFTIPKSQIVLCPKEINTIKGFESTASYLPMMTFTKFAYRIFSQRMDSQMSAADLDKELSDMPVQDELNIELK